MHFSADSETVLPLEPQRHAPHLLPPIVLHVPLAPLSATFSTFRTNAWPLSFLDQCSSGAALRLRLAAGAPPDGAPPSAPTQVGASASLHRSEPRCLIAAAAIRQLARLVCTPRAAVSQSTGGPQEKVLVIGVPVHFYRRRLLS